MNIAPATNTAALTNVFRMVVLGVTLVHLRVSDTRAPNFSADAPTSVHGQVRAPSIASCFAQPTHEFPPYPLAAPSSTGSSRCPDLPAITPATSPLSLCSSR